MWNEISEFSAVVAPHINSFDGSIRHNTYCGRSPTLSLDLSGATRSLWLLPLRRTTTITDLCSNRFSTPARHFLTSASCLYLAGLLLLKGLFGEALNELDGNTTESNRIGHELASWDTLGILTGPGKSGELLPASSSSEVAKNARITSLLLCRWTFRERRAICGVCHCGMNRNGLNNL